jgi:SAM-dependent methyltransferase
LPAAPACGSNPAVELAARIRTLIKAGRKRRAMWVRVLDLLRLVPTAEGRARLWTRTVHRDEVHQTTPYTEEDRYPELFDVTAALAPAAQRILSFGCSTGEELEAIRRRYPVAEIVGAEINPRSRRLARRLTSGDARTSVVPPTLLEGDFDVIFALAVFQREPHKIDETETNDISSLYRFDRFDAAITGLVERLRPGGLLCVINAQYRVEDSSAYPKLQPVKRSPPTNASLFGPDGRRLAAISGRTIFRKGAGRRGGGP